MIGIALCVDCIHLNRPDGRPKCKAFPDGIPDEIIQGRVEHNKPYPGDHGIMFEPKPAKPAK